MRIKIHHKIGKSVCSELKHHGCKINESLFLFGNLFPDLIHSYIWRLHDYQHSREYVRRKLNIRTFSIEELDRFVKWYDNFRASVIDDELDFHIAAIVTSNFLCTAY